MSDASKHAQTCDEDFYYAKEYSQDYLDGELSLMHSSRGQTATVLRWELTPATEMLFERRVGDGYQLCAAVRSWLQKKAGEYRVEVAPKLSLKPIGGTSEQRWFAHVTFRLEARARQFADFLTAQVRTT